MRDDATDIAESLQNEVLSSSKGIKRLKVKSLLHKFGFKQRSENNTREITQILGDQGMQINPSIVRFADNWKLGYEDWVYLSTEAEDQELDNEEKTSLTPGLPEGWNDDGWFEAVKEKVFISEREVETKFIIPLLGKLGYSDDDRHDEMPVDAAYGSKPITLSIDFALFANDSDILNGQVLLVVEAKKEERLRKKVELNKAERQAKSYALWVGCKYCLITDSNTIEVLRLTSNYKKDDKLLFSCTRDELEGRFGELYALISKNVLAAEYIERHGNTEEIKQEV